MAEAIHNASAEPSAEPSLEELAARIGLQIKRARGWYSRVVHRAFGRSLVKWGECRARTAAEANGRTARARAHAAIRSACLKSAGAGAAAGAVTTGAAVFAAETGAWGVVAVVPVTAAAIGGEMVVRAKIHVDLACHLAEIYGVPFDPVDEDDLWRLYALVFETCDGRGRDDRGKGMLEDVAGKEAEDLGESLGPRLLEDALLRDIVPFVAVATSAVGNYLATRRLGQAMRRYVRYDRAMRDAVQRASGAVLEHLDLLVEGIWYVFVADGTLTPEEAATIAHLLRAMEPAERRRITARFVEDEEGWIERIRAGVREPAREAFLNALEVAAALDKKVGPPERRILRRVGEVFGRAWDPSNVERLVAELRQTGVAAQNGG